MSDDHLDPNPIVLKRHEIEHLKYKLAIAEAELRGMLEVESLVQSAAPRPLVRPPARRIQRSGEGYRAGRQPGALSKRWQSILRDLHGLPGFGADDLAEKAIAAGFRYFAGRRSEIENRLRFFESHAFIRQTGEGIYIVTDEAAARFRFNAARTH